MRTGSALRRAEVEAATLDFSPITGNLLPLLRREDIYLSRCATLTISLVQITEEQATWPGGSNLERRQPNASQIRLSDFLQPI
jgi:hypothetical protein